MSNATRAMPIRLWGSCSVETLMFGRQTIVTGAIAERLQVNYRNSLRHTRIENNHYNHIEKISGKKRKFVQTFSVGGRIK